MKNLVLIIIVFCSVWTSADRMDLAGPWRFQLDKDDKGLSEKWFLTELNDVIALPSTTDLHGAGEKYTRYDLGRLTRRVRYVGPAWYQRTITIPQKWAHKTVSLFLERCQWESRAWLDDTPLGMRESLSVPHVYELGPLPPGVYTITIRVDNRLKYDISQYAAAVSDQAQTNWNGIIGTIALQAEDKISIASVDYALDDAKSDTRDTIQSRIQIYNALHDHTPVWLSYIIRQNQAEKTLFKKTLKLSLKPGDNSFSHTLDFTPKLWGEYNPQLYRISARIISQDQRVNDVQETRTGFRRFTASQRHFYLNGNRLFLRGTIDVGYNPNVGHPFMKVDRWRHVFTTIKAYGLNHIRFHSWCPPKAAFEAADETGIILQVECPFWGGPDDLSKDAARAAFIREEAFRILEAYKSHPSFCMMSVGNELGEPHGRMLSELVNDLKTKDPRRLYTTTSGHYIPQFLDASLVDDFFISLATPQGHLRGVVRLGSEALDTRVNYNHKIDAFDRPVVLHEVGQWSMYPDLNQRHKYKGNLIAGYLHDAHRQLQKKCLLDQNPEFLTASGRFAADLYKEEIEAAFRTDNCAGFQLLGLTDFPGWGVATIGMLDEFWDNKGLLTAEQFRRFCGQTVLLLETPASVLQSGERINGHIRLANYSGRDIDRDVTWHIEDDQKTVVAEGTFSGVNLEAGQVSSVGRFDYQAYSHRPQKLIVRAWVDDSDITNAWPIWVHPDPPQITPPDDVLISQQWDRNTRAHLDRGGKVLLTMNREQSGYMLKSSFLPVFWAFSFNPAGNSTLGTLLRQEHPIFADFFKQGRSQWNLWDVFYNSDMLIMDQLPKKITPLIQPIDSFDRNFKLGKLFEARVLNGALIFSSIDLHSDLDNRPVTRQLRYSILNYMKSENFDPPHEVSVALLDSILNVSRIEKTAVQKPDEKPIYLDVHTESGKAMVEYLNIEYNRSEFDWPPVVAREIEIDTIDGHTIKTQKNGFQFSLTPQNTEMVSAYLMDHKPLVLTVDTPQGFEGYLWVHFQDWNNKMRRAAIVYRGQNWGFTSEPGPQGRWYKLPIGAQHNLSSNIVLKAKPISGPNILISRFRVTGK